MHSGHRGGVVAVLPGGGGGGGGVAALGCGGGLAALGCGGGLAALGGGVAALGCGGGRGGVVGAGWLGVAVSSLVGEVQGHHDVAGSSQRAMDDMNEVREVKELLWGARPAVSLTIMYCTVRRKTP